MNIETFYTQNDSKPSDWWDWHNAFEAMYSNYSRWVEFLGDSYYSYCNI